MRMSGEVPNDSGARLLLVDDDPSIIALLRRILSEYSHVHFAVNGDDAVRLAREHKPDLILLDGEMPGMSGFEVCEVLKADDALAHIPIIFVTSHRDLAFEARALSLGVADFITKPLSAPRVKLRVRNHLLLKQQMDDLRRAAAVDPLTGLANRRAVDEKLEQEWQRARRSGLPLSLMLIDIDHFKLFNDEYGHPAGDDCIRTVAQALMKAARRPADLAGRYGGEEFAVILPETPLVGALVVAQATREAIAKSAMSHRRSPVSAHVTVSIGVSCYQRAGGGTDGRYDERIRTGFSEQPGSAKMLLEASDRALYAAKHAGRNRVEHLPWDVSFR